AARTRRAPAARWNSATAPMAPPIPPVAGLDPATHVFVRRGTGKDVDARDKPGQGAFFVATPVTTSCPRGLRSFSGGADTEMEAAHDAVADQRRGEIAKAHAKDQRPGKIDARAAAVDAALDPPGGALAAGEKRGRAVPAIGHGRAEKSRAD